MRKALPHQERLSAVTSISIFISGSCNPAHSIVAAGFAVAKAALVTGQQAGQSDLSGRM